MSLLAFQFVEARETVDQALAGVAVEFGAQRPCRPGKIAAGDRRMEPLTECAQLKELLVVRLDGTLNPVDQHTWRQVANAGAVEAVRDDAVLLGSRQPAQA